jgi:cytochrome P450
VVRGVTIPADSRVMLSLISANRDEARHAEPDRYWIERPDNEHVAFGSGIHFCMGSALARLEVATMLAVLLERTSALRRAGEPRFLSTIVVKGPIELPMELAARQRAR